MKKCLPLAFILISIHSLAQIKGYSVSFSGNYPLINSSTQTLPINTIPIAINTGYSFRTLTGDLKKSYDEHAGFDLQGSVDVAVSRRFFITTGLSALYIRYKQAITIERVHTPTLTIAPNVPVTPGAPFGTINAYNYSRDDSGNITLNPESGSLLNPGEKTGETTTLYLELPVLAGTSFFKDKLEVRAGFVGSWLMQATLYKSEVSFQNFSYSVNEYKDKSPDGFNKFLAGVTVQSTYRVTRSIGIDLTVRKYLTPIYENNETQKRDAKYTVLSLGARYTFNP